jgi:hypothetical protein
MSNLKNLDNAQIIALSNALTKKAVDDAKKDLSPASSTVVPPFTVTCDGGKVTIGGPVEYTPTVSLPLLDVLVIALHKAGFQRDGIMKIVTEAANDALKKGSKVGAETKSTVSFVKKEVEALQISLAANLPKQTRKGATKVKVKWD